MILSGKSRSLVARLTAKMQEASVATDFEEAARLRDQVEAVKSVWFEQNVDIGEVVDRDIISIAREESDAVAVVMQLREGALIGRQDFHLTAPGEESDEVMLETFLAQYYNHQPNLPNEVILPFDLKSVHLIRGMLRKLKGRVVKVVTPRKGTNVRLVDLAAANARLLLDELLIQKQKQSGRTSKMVVALKEELKLHRQPRTMVCFDISNTGETDAVGSCVYFENGQPKKNQYRHFKIKGSRRQDDYRMMREVIGRYFYRLKEDALPPPDLVVVDGGKGQLSSALAELKVFGFDQQPVIGLAKRLEEVFLPGISESIVIPRGSPALMLLKNIRDEAHRFAITYNRKVRTKRTIKSALDDIEGIGPARRKMLLKKFGSIARIKNLSVGELAAEKGITPKLAESILKHLREH